MINHDSNQQRVLIYSKDQDSLETSYLSWLEELGLEWQFVSVEDLSRSDHSRPLDPVIFFAGLHQEKASSALIKIRSTAPNRPLLLICDPEAQDLLELSVSLGIEEVATTPLGPAEWHLRVRRLLFVAGRRSVSSVSEALQKPFLDQLQMNVVISNTEGLIEYVNPSFLKYTGYVAEELLGKHAEELGAGTMPRHYFREMWQELLSGKTWQGEFENRRKDGSTYWENAIISPIIDEDGQVQKFLSIQRPYLKSQPVEYQNWLQSSRLGCLNECRKILLECREESSLYQPFADVIDKKLNYELVLIALKDDHPEKRLNIVAGHGKAKDYLDGLNISWDEDEFGQGPAGISVRTGEVSIAEVDDSIFTPWKQLAEPHRFKSIAYIPLVTAEKIFGTIGFYSTQESYGEEELDFLKIFASDLAGGIDDFRDHAKENMLQRALADNEERFRQAISVAKIGVWEYHPLDDQMIFNDRMAQLFELAPNDADKLENWMHRIHSEDEPRVRTAFEKLLQDGMAFHEEFRLQTKDGEYRYIHGHASADKDETGRVHRVFGLSQEFTKLHQMEQTLREERELYRATIECTTAGIWDWDLVSNTEYLSPRFKHMFGYEDHEMPNLPESWQKIIYPDDLEVALGNFNRHVETRGEHPFHQRVRYRHKDGSTVVVICAGEVIAWSPEGRALRMVGCHIDVTDQYEAEQEIKKLRDFLAQTNQSAMVGGWEADLVTKKVTWSDITRVIHDCPEDYVPNVEDGLSFYKRGTSRDAITQAFNHSIKTGEGWDLELKIISVQNNEKWVRTVGQVEMNNGDPIRAFGSFQDITKQKMLEQSLADAKEELEAQNTSLHKLSQKALASVEAKADFLSNMSHEIRTPMNGVLGMTSLLMMTELNEDQRETAEIIQSSASSLLTLLNDILDYSKVEAGEMELENIAFNPIEMFEETAAGHHFLAKVKGIELIHGASPNIAHQMIGDSGRIRQIINNFLSNAVKFTDKGSIFVSMERGEGASGEPFIEFRVRDDGLGISSEQQKKLFARFSQASRDTARKYGGTGLGLSICKQLVELMGGSIGVDSELERGSTFWFRVPYAMGAPLLSTPVPEAFRQCGVMIVTPFLDRLKVFESRLDAWGVKHAHLSSLQEFATGDATRLLPKASRHVVLVDHVAGEKLENLVLRIADLHQKNLPFLLMSSTLNASLPSEVEGAVIHKPCSEKKLLTALAEVLSCKDSLPKEYRGVAQHPIFRGVVLLADDNTVNQKLGQKMLTKLGCQVDTVGNGLEVLDNMAMKDYDLILMDVHMPDMDGLEATKRVRQSVKNPDIPILAMTADVMKKNLDDCREVGMNGHIAKPVTINSIASALQEWLPLGCVNK